MGWWGTQMKETPLIKGIWENHTCLSTDVGNGKRCVWTLSSWAVVGLRLPSDRLLSYKLMTSLDLSCVARLPPELFVHLWWAVAGWKPQLYAPCVIDDNWTVIGRYTLVQCFGQQCDVTGVFSRIMVNHREIQQTLQGSCGWLHKICIGVNSGQEPFADINM